MTKLTV